MFFVDDIQFWPRLRHDLVYVVNIAYLHRLCKKEPSITKKKEMRMKSQLDWLVSLNRWRFCKNVAADTSALITCSPRLKFRNHTVRLPNGSCDYTGICLLLAANLVKSRFSSDFIRIRPCSGDLSCSGACKGIEGSKTLSLTCQTFVIVASIAVNSMNYKVVIFSSEGCPTFQY